VDKTTAFGLPFFYRIVMPGGIAAILLLPLLQRVLLQIGVSSDGVAAAAVGVALFVGFVIESHDDEIYKVYEGLRWWPVVLRTWRTSHWQQHVLELLKRSADRKLDEIGRGAIWSELTDFPQTPDGKTREATRPTRLGNILAGYEGYPHRRYGMNAYIFWPRLWAVVPKDARESFERDWAVADAWIHTAAALIVAGIAYVSAGLLSALATQFGLTVAFETEGLRAGAVAGGAFLIVLSYLPYHWSLAGQSKNGAAYRSTFDIYQADLKITLPNEDQWKKWDELGNQLLYAEGPEKSSKARTREAEKK
jgi:hypothetical protein